ncbi:MAG TPA: YkvA family protein [Ignavibacteria bacterium]|nr:DUF1232 domain-containing protein [Bacteroidota bacterium]HRE09492.1 YkvA family protein [Ignavibacteria bacterium]HRF64616.1 YkvA family protein [Ignavibacteria bacterium]HRJ05033.1 YkvA family protein [Ignavibacteria bacterium]HRJ85307.1 YkvA family protein [Ignavibacteria bacterium]
MKNKLELSEAEEISLLQEYYPERPFTEKETEALDRDVEKKITSNKRSIFKVISHLKALRRYMTDSNVKWYRKSIVVAALIYFITPLDAMPDFAPLLGYLDDIGVIGWTIKFLGEEITSYYD